MSPSGGMAFDAGTCVPTGPDGATDSGTYLVVWIKEDARFRIAADMFGSILPPPGDVP